MRYTGLTEFFAEDTVQDRPEEDAFVHGDNKTAFGYGELLLAADLGTTTLAFVCADERGNVLASYGCENPQRKMAADVIGRIDAALQGQGERLSDKLRGALATGFLFVYRKGTEALFEAGVRSPLPVRIAVAGNTTMQHLLMGYPMEGMAKAPFLPYMKEMQSCSFSELFGETEHYGEIPQAVRQAEVTLFPCLSAFVGGDAVAGAYGVFTNRKDRNELLIDLGTNGELLLAAKGKWYGTAAAMGSAFEGGRYAYASELFRKMRDALERGIIDSTGLLSEPYFSEGYEGVLQEDVREFQLAKGALRAGIELLCTYAGTKPEQIDRVYLAGGIGRFCDETDLFRTGLLPTAFEQKVVTVGNSCMGGLLLWLKNKETVLHCRGEILNLAEQPEFESFYYRFMNFEEGEAFFEG